MMEKMDLILFVFGILVGCATLIDIALIGSKFQDLWFILMFIVLMFPILRLMGAKKKRNQKNKDINYFPY